MTAYGIAVKHGYVGTEEEWLKSLNAYLHIKFSHYLPHNNYEMQDTPAEWIGIATSKSEEAPEDYTAYTWIYVKGTAEATWLAPAYKEKPYAKGDIVSFGEGLYRCILAITTPMPFDSTYWETITVGELVTEAKTIPDGGVKARNIGDGEVTEPKIADGAVTERKHADGSVTEPKIANRAVTGEKLKLDKGDLPTIKLTKGIHYYDDVSQAPTQAGILSFIKFTE